ncbi:hypothetical protein MTR67_051312 [Solanum verrucosum]|uniref:Tf2-1-like SH3-like domain-containing protein n=1 Tax=Solanum verrucosum TaxID=315347 RepID=A0AAF0V4M9_SOLVR|nr:hypothetical protein MTR67_051312 [Solanum verrucosum]
MDSVAHVEEERKELARDVHKLARLGIRLMSISDGGVTVQNRAESSLVVEVKEKQDNDRILLELKGAIHQQRVEVFSQWGDDMRRRELEFQVDDWIFLKVSPMKGVMRFGKKGKLSPRYVGPYRILKRIVSIVPLESVAVKDSLSYEDVPVEILNRQVRRLRNKEVASVKVLWRSQSAEGATWEAEASMKSNVFECSWNSVQSEIQFSVFSGGTHRHHPRTVGGSTVRPAGLWFVSVNFPRTQPEIRPSVDPRLDLRSVGQVTDRGSCAWIDAPKTQLQSQLTVDQHGLSFDARSVGEGSN